LAINPSAPEVYNNLGLAYEYTGHPDQAIEANKKVLSLNKFLLEPRLNLARIALSQGDLKTAVDLYSENLKIAPYERRSFELLLTARIDAGQLQEAQAMIQDLGAHSRDAVMITEVANLTAEKNMHVWALDLYMQALRIDPGYKDVYIQAGVLLANLNQLDRALQMWKQALIIDPTDAKVSGLIKKAREMKEIRGNDAAGPNKNQTEN
jgi:tetratricopeptide (TPR) repeat protein